MDVKRERAESDISETSHSWPTTPQSQRRAQHLQSSRSQEDAVGEEKTNREEAKNQGQVQSAMVVTDQRELTKVHLHKTQNFSSLHAYRATDYNRKVFPVPVFLLMCGIPHTFVYLFTYPLGMNINHNLNTYVNVWRKWMSKWVGTESVSPIYDNITKGMASHICYNFI